MVSGIFFGFFTVGAVAVDVEVVVAFNLREGLEEGKDAFFAGETGVPDNLEGFTGP